MIVLSVDLASKFSAWVVLNGTEVLAEGDSRGLTAFEFCKKIRAVADEYQPDRIGFEDVPYGISNQAMVKPALRLQGVLMICMHPWLDKVVWINPSTWQKTYYGVGSIPKGVAVPASRRDEWRATQAAQHALKRGYRPPDLVAQWQAEHPASKALVKIVKPLRKSMTDYVDAFLMGLWLADVEDPLLVPGCQPTMI